MDKHESNDASVKEFEFCGHAWRWYTLSEDRGALHCLDPFYDDEDTDQTEGPDEEQLSAILGFEVAFLDAGDHPDYPESIYQIVRGE